MPKGYKSFCLVAAHLVKNGHRYWDNKCDVTAQLVNNEEVHLGNNRFDENIKHSTVTTANSPEAEQCENVNA